MSCVVYDLWCAVSNVRRVVTVVMAIMASWLLSATIERVKKCVADTDSDVPVQKKVENPQCGKTLDSEGTYKDPSEQEQGSYF